MARRHASAFAGPLAARTLKEGLAVTRPDGSVRAIPVTATPVVIEPTELRRRALLSKHLSLAALKMSRARLGGLLDALSPLERRLAAAGGGRLCRLACARVDFFISDRPQALEVNATIPAMQAYSDIAADAFIEAVGRHGGLTAERIAQLQRENGSNARALYTALLSCYAQERTGAPRRMAILVRRQDAQLTEVHALARRFSDWGTETVVAYPDELSGEDAVRARGEKVDLVYRHLFVRRLEETPSPYVARLLSELPSPRAVVVNPPASQVEVKTTFAWLSMALEDGPLAQAAMLTDDELAAIREALPWTRPFGPELVEQVAARPMDYVLKRAWDYGGKTVFVGPSAEEASFEERVRATYGRPMDWPQLCARAAADPAGGGFVVQSLVPTAPESHLLCTEQGPVEANLHVDFSAYASCGLNADPAWGGVCRGSVSQIVNIVGGGGVLPLLTTPVADALLLVLQANGREASARPSSRV